MSSKFNDEQALNDLRSDFKFRMMEKIIKQFFTESLEALLLKQQDQIHVAETMATIGDIAKKFQVTKATVHNWIRRGIISGTKVGKNRYFTNEEIRSIVHFLKK